MVHLLPLKIEKDQRVGLSEIKNALVEKNGRLRKRQEPRLQNFPPEEKMLRSDVLEKLSMQRRIEGMKILMGEYDQR